MDTQKYFNFILEREREISYLIEKKELNFLKVCSVYLSFLVFIILRNCIICKSHIMHSLCPLFCFC